MAKKKIGKNKTRSQKRNESRNAKRDTLAPIIQNTLTSTGAFLQRQENLRNQGRGTEEREGQLIIINLLSAQLILLWNIYDPRG